MFQVDTARHLEWLKTVKESHGSVELSSLSLASSINTKGTYVISARNVKRVNNCIKMNALPTLAALSLVCMVYDAVIGKTYYLTVCTTTRKYFF